MKLSRRMFSKGFLGTIFSIPTILKATEVQAQPQIEQVCVESEKEKIAKTKLTKQELIELILYHEPIRFEGGIMDVKPKWKVNKKVLRSALNTMTKTELIVHAKEFYGLDFFTQIDKEN